MVAAFGPGPIAASMFCCPHTESVGFVAVGDDPFHPLPKCDHIRFKHPALTGEFHAADAMADGPFGGRDLVGKFVGGEIICTAAGGHDYGETASHRFKDRQTEPFAAIRMHETVARRVKRGQGIRRQFFIEVENFRRGWNRLGGFDLCFQRLASVHALPAKIFNHQADVVGRGEVGEISFEQDIRTLAGDGCRRQRET